MKLRLRIILIICVGISLALAVGYSIGAAVSSSLQRAISEAHDAHLLNTLESNVQSRLSIGLSLAQLESLQPAIEMERVNAPGLLSIDVYSDKGFLLYSTDRSAVGTQVPTSWVAALYQSPRWHFDGLTERVIGTRIEDDLGVPIGGIALTIDTQVPKGTWSLQRLANALPDGGLALGMLISLLAGIIASVWGLAWVFRPIEAAHTVLNATNPDPVHTAENALSVAVWKRRARWTALQRDLEEALAQLEALDREN